MRLSVYTGPRPAGGDGAAAPTPSLQIVIRRPTPAPILTNWRVIFRGPEARD